MVSLGLRADDPKSGSSALSRNRTISTYYHSIENVGLAQVHIGNIAEKVGKATDEEPHELVVRLRAAGGDTEYLREVLTQAKRELGTLENASKFRIFQNSDGSIDAELRVDTNGSFDETLLNFGEVSRWPKGI